jgi:hypothetical protein
MDPAIGGIMQNIHTGFVESFPDSPKAENPRSGNIIQSNLVSGEFLMVGIALLLFFLPVVNGVVAGLVGGYKVGQTKGAILASIIPAMAVACGLWILLTLSGLPDFGYKSDLVRAALATMSTVVLVICAAIGGTIAQNKTTPANRA